MKKELDLFVRSIRGKEKSGIELKRLKTSIKAKEGHIKLEKVELELPSSRVTSDSVSVKYDHKNPKALEILAYINGSRITPADLSAFNAEIISKIPPFTFEIDSRTDSTSSRTAIYAKSFNENFALKTIAQISNPYDNDRKANIYIRDMEISRKGMSLLQSYIRNNKIDLVDKIGHLNLTAEAEITKESIKGNARAATANGEISTAGTYDKGEFSITANGYDIDISNLANLDTSLKCSLQTSADGCINDKEKNIRLSATITDLESSKYTFAPIEIAGTYDLQKSHICTDIKTTDPGVTAKINLDYTFGNEHKANLSVDVDSITPCTIGLNEKKNETFSFSLDGEFNQDNNGNRLVNAKVKNLTFKDDIGKSTIKNLHFCDTQNEEQRLILLNSDFINCSVIGVFDYKSIVKSLYRQTIKHIPSITAGTDTITDNECNYIFKCDLKDSRFISHMLKLPFTINEPSFINGNCNEKNGQLAINTVLNDIDFKKSKYKAIGFNGKSTNEALTLETVISKPSKKGKDAGDLKIDINCKLFNDTIQNLLNWGNSQSARKMNGRLRMEATVGRDSAEQFLMNAKIQPDSIIHNDSIWYISGGNVYGNLDCININGLYLYNDSQHLRLNGCVGKNPEDTLSVSVSNLEVSTILDLVKFRILQFNGNATGSAYASGLLSAPEVNGNFKVDSFKIDNGYLGKTDLNIGWRNSDKSIFLDADIYNDKGNISNVNGFLSQANDTIHIEIDADEINAVFINKMVRSFMSDIDGTGSGKVYLLGKWKGIDMTGAVSLNCSARVNQTNVKYKFHGDTLYMTKGKLTFNEAFVTDKYGNKGWLSGNVTHKNLGSWVCDLSARTEKILVYDTYNFDQIPVYGTVFATGNANLKANDKGLFLKAEVSNDPNSRIIYNASESGSVSDNSFVKFTDSSKKYNTRSVAEKSSDVVHNIESKLNLDFLLDINEGMQIKVYTNLKSDDYIDLYGRGTVNAIYDEKDGFSLKGNMDLDRGAYKITIQDIFTKEFSITKGSSLQFNGNPYEANLDLKAKYFVPSASLSALTTETTTRKNVKVNCLLGITGTLESPVLSFDLELPEGSEEEKEMLASATSTPEQKNTQFIYLLSIGKFYTYDYTSPLATGTQNTTAVESLISNALSGQLNNMLGQIIDNNNWNISGNISTSERGWNDMEVEGMLEGRLLNDRLLINGNFGYRENPVANRNFIGDFELQWLLNKKGTVSLKAYSKTNDRYFSKTNLTTQGAGIMLRHDFNKWIWWKKENKKKNKSKKKDE
ncbi:MAG: translocation/assembly module TamB domain-containing protein [Bacteroidaceae bacterium]|nr:translocation/assembly module TamB domain-containing protein [Bacteroidaceae bacterium]